jgi:hypothetical protein
MEIELYFGVLRIDHFCRYVENIEMIGKSLPELPCPMTNLARLRP